VGRPDYIGLPGNATLCKACDVIVLSNCLLVPFRTLELGCFSFFSFKTLGVQFMFVIISNISCFLVFFVFIYITWNFIYNLLVYLQHPKKRILREKDNFTTMIVNNIKINDTGNQWYDLLLFFTIGRQQLLIFHSQPAVLH
jgi:hypothetical protein